MSTEHGVLDRFAGYDTGTISDALESLGLRGSLSGLSPLSNPRAVVGLASTVQLASDDGTPSSRHLCARAIDASDADSVIVVAGGRLDCGGWGGLLSRAAARRGIRAAVIDGMSRDIDEAVLLEFPIFARGATPVTARGKQREISSGEPVTIGEIRVAQGDIVVADRSGVVIVPQDRAHEVLLAAQSVAARETVLAGRLDSGEPVASVMAGNYEAMLRGKRKE